MLHKKNLEKEEIINIKKLHIDIYAKSKDFLSLY